MKLVISDKRHGSGIFTYFPRQRPICLARENRKKFLGFEERKRSPTRPSCATLASGSCEKHRLIYLANGAPSQITRSRPKHLQQPKPLNRSPAPFP